jgi:hypothetical protein
MTYFKFTRATFKNGVLAHVDEVKLDKEALREASYDVGSLRWVDNDYELFLKLLMHWNKNGPDNRSGLSYLYAPLSME